MPRCNSPSCAGCYEVDDGVWIHPPKSKGFPLPDLLPEIWKAFVKLTPTELAVAWRRAREFEQEARRQGKKPSFGKLKGNEVETDFMGIAGEIAWCKYFNKHWREWKVGVYPPADIGLRVEVRARSEPWHDLRVKPAPKVLGIKEKQEDWPDHAFFHLIFFPPDVFHIVGWLWGHEAQEYQLSDPDGLGLPIHFVPRKFLHKLEELPADVLAECPGPYVPPL